MKERPNISRWGTCYLDLNPSTDYLAQTVKQETSTSLSTPCMSTFTEGEPFTLQASVSPSSDTSGTISFTDSFDYQSPLAISGCGGSTPTQGCTTSALAAGHHSFKAIYNNIDFFSASSNSHALVANVLAAAYVLFRNGLEADTAQCPVE
jgi:hypothetical protein